MDGREDNIDALGQSSATPEAVGAAPEMPSPTPAVPAEPATSTAEGGIFSGEDTRVETENLPVVPEVVQQAPASSISPTLRTTSTVTGDLHLGGTTKKKKWWIPIAAVVAVTVVAVGGWALLNSQKGEGVEQKLEKYAELLNNAPAGAEWNQESEHGRFVEDLVNGVVDLEQSQLDEYVDSLDSALTEVSDATQRSYGNKKREAAQYVIDDVAKLTDMNGALRIFLQTSKTLEELDKVFMQKGLEAALESVPQYTELIGNDMTAYFIYSSLTNYMEAYLSRNDFFNRNGCFSNGVVSEGCMQRVSDGNIAISDEANNVLKNFSRARNHLYQAGNMVCDTIYSYIEEMQSDLKEVTK